MGPDFVPRLYRLKSSGTLDVLGRGAVAQLGERRVRNAKVGSSILLRSTTIQTNQPFPVGFSSVPSSVGTGSGLSATDAAAPDSPVSGGFRSQLPPILCFSVSAEEDFAPGPATARVSGCLFVTEAAFTQATQPWNGLPAHDGPNVPGDRRLGSIAHHLATLDAVVQVFCQRFVVLRNFCLMARSTALRKAVLNVLPPQTRPRAHPGALHGRGAARGRRRALRGEDGAPCRPVAAAAGGNGAAGCGDRGPSAGAVGF